MSTSDRNQKLKNYHARKVRERQLQQIQQQQQQQHENVENSGGAPKTTPRPTVAVAPLRGATVNNAATTSFTASSMNSTQMKRSNKNNLMNNNNSGGGGLSNVSLSNTSVNNRGRTQPIASSRSSRSLFAATAKPTATTATTTATASATTSSSKKSFANNNKSFANNNYSTVKLNRLVDDKHDKVQEGGHNNGAVVSRSTKGVVTNSFGLRSSSNVATALSSAQKSAPSTTTAVANSTTGTNNAMEAARMFAARRRRAQLEMNVKSDAAGAGGDDGSTTAKDGSDNRGGSSNNSVGSSSATSKNSRGMIKSGGVRSGGGTSSFATRMAYERYIASNAGGSSVPSATSGGSGGRTNHYGGSKSSGGSVIGSARAAPSSSTLPSSVIPKSGHGGNVVGGSSSSRGGINTMNSMDSADNSTLASVPSAEDYSDNIGLSSSTSTMSNDDDSIDNRDDMTRDRLKSLATVREESSTSFSSMATIQVSNTGRNKTVVSSDSNGGGVKTPQGDRSGDHGANVVKNEPPAAPTPIHEGILRPPHHESSKANTDEEEVDGHHSKSVRFHLSPLERQKKIDEDNTKKKRVTRVAAAPTTEVTVGRDQILSLNSSSAVVTAENAASGDEQQEDDDFAMFIDGLRREVAGDHTKLWSEFQSILGHKPQEHVPLYSDDDKVGSSGNDSKKKKKKIRMDPQTTNTLNTIYKRFQKEDEKIKSSSRRFMTNKSQLKNDKDIAKQHREEKKIAAATAAVEIADEKKPKNEEESSTPLRRSRLEHRSNHNHTSSSKGENELATFKLRPTPTKAKQNDITSTPNRNPAFNVKLRPTPTKTPPPTESKQAFSTPIQQKSFAVGVTNSISKRSPFKRSSSKSSSGGRSATSPKEDKANKSPKWIASLKKKQKFNRLKQMAESNSISVQTQGETDGIGGVLLKQVSPRKKLRTAPPPSPEEKEGQVPPWAKVQLRSTPKRDELLADTPTNGSVTACSTPKSFTPIAAATPSSTNRMADTSLPSLCSVGDIIDLDSLPNKLFPEEVAAVFPLKSKNENDELVQFVIVGTIAIVTASSTSGSSSGRKVKITWWCHRSAIRTLTLNVEATGATLAHAHGRTPIVFESSDICLDFAQAFYRGPSKEDVSVPTSSQSSPAHKEAPKESSPKGAACVNDESTEQVGNTEATLTEEEESLLDEYRKFAESEKPKLRLTCLSPKGEEVVEVTFPDKTFASNATTDTTAVKTTKEGVGSSLTNEETNLVSKYKKMLAVGLPPPAVRQKMNLEGAPANVVAAVLGDDNNKTAADETESSVPKTKTGEMSEEEEKLVSKYKKMLMVGIPPDAVRHKMVTEGIELKVVAAVLGDDHDKKESESEVSDPRQALMAAINKKGKDSDTSTKPSEPIDPRQALFAAIKNKGNDGGSDSPSKSSAPSDPKQALFAAIKNKGAESSKSNLTEEEEKVASKYKRMLKMGVPLDAVKHSMTKEGVDSKIAAAVAEEASPQVTASESIPTTPARPKSVPKTGPVLSEEEEKIAAKYRKMLKLCIPKDAVRHDMRKEGVSDRIVEAIFGKEDASANNSANIATPATKGKNRKTIALHWTTSNLAPEQLQQSIFARSASKKRKLMSINPEESDIKKLEELFQKKNNANTGQLKTGQSNAGNGMAKLLDIPRANNIAIQLKAFNDFTLRELAETINDLDPESKIVGERIQFISQLLPTPKELQVIKKYKGESDKLITAELFFQQLLPVKRVEDKVEVMKAMCTFNEHAEEAIAAFKTLEEVCGQIMDSKKLEQILLMVLNIGNLMNEGTLDGGVEAFKFESLEKLSQTKSADGKTTVLDYIVETFIGKGERDTLFLTSDFPDIQECCRLSINDLCGDVNTLRKNFELCKRELNSMKKDQAPKTTQSVQKKENVGEAADPRKTLFAAIQARGASDGDSSSKPPAPVDPRQALFAAIKNKGAEPSNNADAPAANVEYSRGVKRLESFLWKADKTFSQTERDQNAAIRACRGLAVYCGEEGGERSASSLLQILASLASSLVAAVEKYDKKAELSKRKKSAPQKMMTKDKENQVNALPAKKSLLKASSLQPQVGLTDRVKSKTVNGAKPKLSPKKSVSSTSLNNSDDPRSAMFAAIRSRNEPPKRTRSRASMGNDDSRSALFAAIKSRSETPVGVTNKVRTINTNTQRRESRVLMVNKMLKEAPANVRNDFLRGVTYSATNDPLLQKIYEKEGVEKDDAPRPVDPRQELFAAIKSRRQG